MKRLATLALAVILITGCNPMQPNMEETELLSKEIEKRIYAQAWPTESPEIKESKPKPAKEPKPAAPEPAEESEETPLRPVKSDESIEWPYITCQPEPEWPYITCPPEPTPVPQPEWPYITAPEPPTYTPEPEPIELLQEPMPTPQPTPAVPADPVALALEPTEPSAEPVPEHPSGGYAECSCGASLTPEEVLPHMKAHAMNGENHSYRAY